MNTINKSTAIFYLSDRGQRVARELQRELSCAVIIPYEGKIRKQIEKNWNRYESVICIMSLGIVVRSIKDLIVDKEKDPAVVVVDEASTFAVSLLSGHLGGANKACMKIAKILGANPVITTASDVTKQTALDIWCARNKILPTSKSELTHASSLLIQHGSIKVFINMPYEGTLPPDFHRVDNEDDAQIAISHTLLPGFTGYYMYPKTLCLGVGCNRGTPYEIIESCWNDLCVELDIHSQSLCSAASVDLKINEDGLLHFCRKSGLTISFFTKHELNQVNGVSSSDAVMNAIGAKGVAEPAALLCAGYKSEETELIVEKRKWKDVTLAVARKKLKLRV